MQLLTETYLEQVSRLSKSGRHIVVFDDDVVVYQAYSPTIGYSYRPPDMVVLMEKLSSIARVGLSPISCG